MDTEPDEPTWDDPPEGWYIEAHPTARGGRRSVAGGVQ